MSKNEFPDIKSLSQNWSRYARFLRKLCRTFVFNEKYDRLYVLGVKIGVFGILNFENR